MPEKFIRVVLAACVLAGAVAGVGAAVADGRYKKDGDKCVWDGKDSGPDQCQPTVVGRFKKDGDKCVWAAGDKGDDQCKPVKGRFKRDGAACVWSADDSGPNQCEPRRIRNR